MTSSGICMSCGGEVRLYEEHWTEYGRNWIKFTGTCPNCGRRATEYPHGMMDELDKAFADAIRKEHDDKMISELAELGQMGFIRKYGFEQYPTFSIRHDGETVGRKFYTIDDARHSAWAMLPIGAEFTICQMDRPRSVERVPEDGKNILAHMRFAIPRWYGDEGGWEIDLDVAFSTLEDAERFEKDHMKGMYYRWTIEEASA